MSTQSRSKKGGGAAMPSSTNITKTDVSEDSSPTQNAMLEPESPTNAGGGDPDKQGGALVIPAKAKVGKKMINVTGVAISRGSTYNLGKGKKGQNQELHREELRL